MTRSRITTEVRFWSKVRKVPGGCWEWQAARMPRGYGRFGVRKGQVVLAHRYAWELTNGRPPAHGMDICHKCDNPPCCNPDCLFEGTRVDNMQDCAKKHRTALHERNGQSKVTLAQVEEMRSRYAAGGVTQRELGYEYGITRSAVGYIVTKKVWL